MDEYRQRDSLSFEKVTRKKQRSRYLMWSLDNPLLIAGYIALVAFCVIWVVGSNVESESSVMERSDVGTIAAFDYKAPRDFTFDRVDREATDRIRAQRVSEVLPIFQWDRTYHDATLARIRNAFEVMRRGIEEERGKRESMLVARDEPGRLAQSDARRQDWVEAILGPYAGEDVFSEYLTTRRATPGEVEQRIDEWCGAHREVFVQAMGYVVDDELYAWLSRARFSQSLEDGLVQDFDVVLGRMIVSTRQEIDSVDRMTIQWVEGVDKRQRQMEQAEKSTISTLSESETLIMTLLREHFDGAPEAFLQYFKQFVRPNMAYDEASTARERQSVSDKTAELRVIEEYKKGQTIVARGNPIKESHYEVFEKIAQSQGDGDQRGAHWAALVLVCGVLLFLVWRSVLATTSRRQKNRDVLYFATSVLVYAFGLRVWVLLSSVLGSVYHWPFTLALLFPFAAGPMLIRIVVNRYYAYLFSVVSIVLAGLTLENNISVMTYAVVCSMSGCLWMGRPKRSNAIFQGGLWVALIGAAVSLAVYLFSGAEMTNADYVVVALIGGASGLLSAGCVMIGLPVAESLFGYVTSNKLLELSNLEHPALKALFLEAPGTYQHSIMVGALNEAAADAIGANSILARVGGYYHDIGKVKNAQYFAENQHGDNPHNRLKPNMSALILKTHERDGLEIARRYRLPQDIRDFIATHHGTSRIEYFYQRAKEQQDRVREEDYRYPGPRPQTRETGICMVSDMVEAAVRSLPDKSPDKILVLVHKLINHKFTDGQFDECDLTLRDLNDIANALIGILNAFYHHRPEYPDQKKERERQEAEKRDRAESEKRLAQSAASGEQSSARETASASQTGLTQTSSESGANVKQETRSSGAEKAVSSSPEKTPVKAEKINKTSDKADKTSDKPDKTSDKPDKASDKPDKASDKPDKASDKPDKASDKPDKASDKPDKASDEVENPPAEETRDKASAEQGDAQEDGVGAEGPDSSEGVGEEDSEAVADALLKEEPKEEESRTSPGHELSIQEAYDLTFSSQVDVFKRN